ncbi:PREDICTED: uncharacterized protein LOC104823550 isoform X1 [Tarenaya hassleriana]|uniref:uncharacterized protein LOC104823550 isoform X1 n=1 Tax=Tarenaya hassleriana TaxID=28532 RepID=UPI00053C3911|nr:PREDICTED: uncharacterized protein LOC104823550 isoform X1 [Tarenaya hassleriana]XP_010553478.1 PREDICTED: uncharacterized protein LOC104823550 isoform X1 [Tarenaya hassleriana]
MAMPPGSVIPSDKMQFPAASAPPAGHWIPDERDGFISWLRSEFAAANAIIDSLCQHLRAIGDPGEYDAVISAIHQRRFNWTPVLHMQQYFPVADVVYTLQQIAWKREQQPQALPPPRHFVSDHGKFGGTEFRRSGPGTYKLPGGQRGAAATVKDGQNSNLDCHSVDRYEKREESKLGGRGNSGKDKDDNALSVAEEKRGTEGSENLEANSGNSKDSGNSEESEIVISETQAGLANHKSNLGSKVFLADSSLSSEQKQNEIEKESPRSKAKAFVVTEMYEGKTVNVVEGLKLYDELFDAKEVSQLVSLVNDMRVSGKRGQLQGQSYVANKRPMRGRGRELIQLGLPIVDSPVDCEAPTDRKVEPIPTVLHDVIERLVAMQIAPMKPDACIIDFYNEGDHSQPNMFLPWFGRPVCIMLLSECDVTFGRVIVSDHPGDYKGSLKLSLTPGSVLVVQGKSADLAKLAIDSTRKQRVLVTFVKSQPRKSITGSNWGPPPSRSLSNHHFRHPSGPPKHYHSIPTTTGVLPAPPNGVVQPLFIAPAPPMPFPAASVAAIPPPGPSGWSVPRHQPPPPRMPLPGTGVFLPPPGSGSNPDSLANSDNGNGNSRNSSEEKVDKKTTEAWNGDVAGEENGEDKRSS